MKTMREKLEQLKCEIDDAERAPFKFLTPVRIVGVVRLLWGLLSEIVNHLEREHGKGRT